MTRRLVALFANILLLGILPGCGTDSAAAYYKSVYYDTMDSNPNPYYVLPENDWDEAEQEIEPEFEEILLQKNMDVIYGVKVSYVNSDKVVFKYDATCIDAKIYTIDNKGMTSFSRNGKNGRIILNMGEELVLYDISLLDASHTVYIRLK